MWPTVGLPLGIQISLFGVVAFLAWAGISFVTWRRMRIDYEDEKILAFFARMGILVIVVSWLIAYVSRWITIGEGVGWFFGIWLLVVYAKNHNWDVWEWADNLSIPLLIAATILAFAWGPDSLIKGGVLGVGVIISWLVKQTYRNFKWYKSGKLGFVCLFVLIWWSLTEIVIAMIIRNGLYWGGLTANQWIATWTLTASVVMLYWRSGNKIWLTLRKRRPRV